jgi:hypothetical protein
MDVHEVKYLVTVRSHDVGNDGCISVEGVVGEI